MQDLFAYLCDQDLIGTIPGMIDGSIETTQCAWCLQEHGEELGYGSHGCCADHRDQITRERKNRKHEVVQ